MDNFNAWLELFIRWTHVFAGIMWVGATFYFTWLDGQFTELEKDTEKKPGDDANNYVWMVHSGGFYKVEKQKRPTLLTQKLHWFKWEAGITWISGILLFGLMYYHGSLLISLEDSPLTKGKSIGLSFGMIMVGWLVYDLLWKFCRNGIVGIIISYLCIVGAAWVSCHYFSSRGAYLQIGAMLGTIMAANVWMRILPCQRRMVKALKYGTPVNLKEGVRAKTRSKHNTFIVFPVVFTMISNHYPQTYGSQYNWVILSVMVLLGWVAAVVVRRA